jgi:hypothetical protein
MDFGQPFSLRFLVGTWLVAIAMLVAVIALRRRREQKDLANFIANLPQQHQLSEAGITMEYSNGTSVFSPWTVVERWRDIRSFILLGTGKIGGTMPVPVGDLAEPDLERLHELLTLYLGKATVNPS